MNFVHSVRFAFLTLFFTLSLGNQSVFAQEFDNAGEPIDSKVKKDLDFAQDSFKFLKSKAVFVDFKTVNAEMVIDVPKRSATVTSTITFEQPEDGHFIFDLVPEVNEFWLDGEIKSAKAIYFTDDPDKVTKLRINLLETKAGTHEVKIVHKIAANQNLKIGTTFIDFMSRMSDLAIRGNTKGRRYMEQYVPSNMEWDQYDLKLDIEINGSETSHMLKTNGEATETAKNSFKIDFPDYFSSSSFFIHVFNPKLYVFKPIKDLRGINGPFHVDIYSRSEFEASKAKRIFPGFFKELESTFGAFLFDSFTAHITRDGGGMEYGGATDTSNWALSHEAFHSYFARGVIPASGNAGWIDEGLASWRDDGYPRDRTGRIIGRRARLSGFSQYQRHTSIHSYEVGARMFSKIDRAIFNEGQRGGLRPILKTFVQEHAHRVFDTPMFFNYLQARTKTDLQPYFDYFVFAKN